MAKDSQPMKKEAFISRIREAIGDAGRSRNLFPESPSPESQAALDRVRSRDASSRKPLWAALIKAAEPLHLVVQRVADPASAGEAIARLVLEKDPEWGDEKRVISWRHPLIEKTGIVDRLAGDGIPVIITEPGLTDKGARARFQAEMAASFVGITSADFCLAETATLVLRTRPGQPRSVSLVPSIHVAVVTEDQILADLKELYALLRWDPRERDEGLTDCLSLITGPSKTADIEATLIHGAHGPKELHLFVCGQG
jgi:L-lactate dehydrogenase complex protein LldG